MDREHVENRIFSLGLVPVIKIDRPEDAVPLCRALLDGGLPVAEITFRTAAAAEAIGRVTRELPDMLVGAGTVTSVELAEKALDAGSRFVVTPGFNPEVVRWCLEREMPIYPGCTTASEVEQAMNLGLRLVKFFPAEQSGGLAKIQALAAPYPVMNFMPTGGVNQANLAQYLASPKITACGGSFMVPEDKLAARDWEGVAELTRSALGLAHGFKLAHVGMYAGSPQEAADFGARFSRMTSQAVKDGASSLFVGPGLEIMKIPGPGWKAHLGYEVLSVERSRAYLEALGHTFDEAGAKRDASGRLIFIYLKDVIGGFAVHLIQSK